ncbi:N-alpha-acetyltransferase 20 [Cystobasidiomycetes sp. EMM_F5]
MSLLRPWRATDMFRFNHVNLDAFTETYSISYYLDNHSRWPGLFCSTEDADGKLTGYNMGKTEGHGEEWHGHVTALTVSPSYRRLGLARKMMEFLENMSDVADCYFVDLYVRMSNELAISMYERMGYTVFRRVRDYYGGGVQPPEDAFGIHAKTLFKRQRAQKSQTEWA